MGKGPSLTAMNAARPEGLRRIDNALAEIVTDEDLKKIVTKFKDKALEGHVASANFLLKLMGSEQQPQTVVVNQFYSDCPVSKNDSIEVVETTVGVLVDKSPLVRVSTYLSVAGRSSPEAIAQGSELDVKTVIATLDNHPTRFSVFGNQYELAK